ncbi:uncharacterized protein F4822DRAFT_105314 [Hypoxylon trugodes]|uniref:uncharacterized protein n=1 Tax=Hypoxylon trugodes TaxID=326681 RepID=UPI0021912584|nr:uncharacterized protein F4822DRAFT_105314 [Hypoxylon trugodes]KAI1391778.1 hypothetical protein F4822DRAFT_105314 [Hypoxylon trugodes]
MPLLHLPSELLLQIMGHLRDSQDVESLRSAARTCQILRGAAEVYLYSTAEFTTLSRLYRFSDAIRAQPKRKDYLQDLKLLYSTRRYNPGEGPSPPDLTSLPNLVTFVSESPECQPMSTKGTHWNQFMDSYMRAFEQASLLNDSLQMSKPLKNLRSITLHWSSSTDRYWDITPACALFLLPQLDFLEISCARVGQVPLKWDAGQLEQFRGQTRLRTLTFTECVVSVEALHTILSFPRALTRLALCEKYYHNLEIGDRFAIDYPGELNRALAQQAGSLEHLQLFRNDSYSGNAGTLALSLSNFSALLYLQLGPFLRPRPHDTDPFAYTIEAPVPPALTTLRLDEYMIFMLEDRRTEKVLSDLLVSDLLVNAETRQKLFTLDVSLQHLPRIVARGRFHGQDARPIVRKLVSDFEKRFQQCQEASLRSHLGTSAETNSEQPFENRFSSHLRVLTNKPRHLIPPFLHNEGLPRYIVRYDSAYPDRFLTDPYVADPIPPDRDTSSSDDDDDDDMDVAFTDADPLA